MCPNCRAFITTEDKVCPYCDMEIGARAIDRRSPPDILGGLIPHAHFTTIVILLINFGLYVAMMLRTLNSGGNVGMDLVAKSAADGYTLGFISAPFTMAPALQSKMPYDTLRDFTPVSKIAESPMVMLVPSTSRFKSPQELIDFAAKNPGVLNYGSGGIGSTPHLTTELLNAMLGIKLTHVPYKGGGESIKALMSGEIDVLIDSITSTDGPIASGRVKAIAIASPRRVPKMPAVPTFEESGIRNFGVTHWVGVVAPARLPAETLNSLHAQLDKALKSPEVVKRLTEIGAETAGSSPSEFARFIQSEVGNWQKAVKAAQIKVSD